MRVGGGAVDLGGVEGCHWRDGGVGEVGEVGLLSWCRNCRLLWNGVVVGRKKLDRRREGGKGVVVVDLLRGGCCHSMVGMEGRL